MGLYKDKIDFDSTNIANSDTVGSYLLDSSGTLLTSTLNGADQSLDVNITGATGLGIYNEDDAASSGQAGQSILGVRQDSLASSTSVDGDYGHIKQNAKGEMYMIDTDANALLTTIDADTGAILTDTNAMVVDLAAIEVEQLAQGVTLDTIAGDTTSMDALITALSKAEDAVHGSGDQGIMSLAVRNDVEGSLAGTDGDYAPLQVDSSGRLRVIGDLDVVGNVADDAADSGNPLKIGSRANFGAAMTAISASNDRADLLSDEFRRVWVNDTPNASFATTKPAILTTQIAIAPSAISSRRRVLIQNLSNRHIYIGPTGVTVATGIRVAKGAMLEIPWGEDLDLFGIGDTGISADVRVLEIA